MQRRGDREHDIAAWFGVNQGRVAEAKDGRHANVTPAPTQQLPPKGPPGLKGRDLRDNVEEAIAHIKKNGMDAELKAILERAVRNYDRDSR
jgi:hypothetical protein